MLVKAFKKTQNLYNCLVSKIQVCLFLHLLSSVQKAWNKLAFQVCEVFGN